MKKLLFLTLAMALGSVVLLNAHLDVPPPGHTGAPGEETCAAAGCHEGADTAGAPGLRFVTFDTYTDSVFIRVILSEGDAGFQTEHVGFQAVVLDPSGNIIGSLSEVNAYVQIDTGLGGRAYVSQTEAGGIKPIESGAIGYEFRWIRDSVDTDSGLVYAIGLWSNGDSTRLGDAQVLDTLMLYPCPVPVTGDVDADGAVTATDVISLINHIFRGGIIPHPCGCVADVDCDAQITVADVIRMINFVFKLQALCDVCPLLWDGTWICD